MYDHARLASGLVRLWRGDRTQLRFSTELGWQSNVAAHWEAGRRFPRASVALRAAEQFDGGASRLVEVLSWDVDWGSRPAPSTPMGVALLLGDVFGHTPIRQVAAALERDTATLYRWLSGQLEPNLRDLLAALDAVSMLGLALRAMAGDHALPGAPPVRAVTNLALRLSMLFGTRAYQELARHDADWLAHRLGATRDELDDALAQLVAHGMVQREGPRWCPVHRRVDVHEHGHLDPEEVVRQQYRVARHMFELPKAYEHLLMGTCSHAERERMIAILRQARRDVLDIVLHSEHTEVAFHLMMRVTSVT